MNDGLVQIAGGARPFSKALAALLAEARPACLTLVNADELMDVSVITARCSAFADDHVMGLDAVIVTILPPSPAGLGPGAQHQAVGALWAFTRAAALQWAPRGIRVNAIGLATSPGGPFEPQEQAGRAAFAMAATPATPEDVIRTILAMAAWRSMTGQIIRLGV